MTDKVSVNYVAKTRSKREQPLERSTSMGVAHEAPVV